MLIETFSSMSISSSQFPIPETEAAKTFKSSRFMQEFIKDHLLGNFYYTNHLLHCQVKFLFGILNCVTNSSCEVI